MGLLSGVVQAVSQTVAGRQEAVEAVGLRVGSLSGAVPEVLTTVWPLVTAGTRLAGARLDIEIVPAAIWCGRCGQEQVVDQFFALTCPVCGTPTGELRRGRQFEVAYADLGDEPAATAEDETSAS